jgi:hypothetical protein
MFSNEFRTLLKRAIIVVMILTLQLLCATIPVRADGQAKVLFDATHKEWGAIWNKGLIQYLDSSGFSVDIHYLLPTDFTTLTQIPISLQPSGPPAEVTFTLAQSYQVLIFETTAGWNYAPPQITVVDPTGAQSTTFFWETPFNIHFHNPTVGVWNIKIQIQPRDNSTENNSIIVGVSNNNPISLQEMSNYRVLILGDPLLAFSLEETSDIVKFVQNGGGLLIAGGTPELNSLSAQFGIIFTGENTVTDKVHNFENWKPLISNFAQHPTVAGLHEIVAGSALGIEAPALGVAFSSPDSSPPNSPVIAVSTFGSGKVVAIGDEYTLSDGDYFALADSKRLALNVLNWLIESQQTTSQATLSTSQATTIATTEESQLSEQQVGSTQIAAAIIFAALIVAAAIILKGKHPRTAEQEDKTRVY